MHITEVLARWKTNDAVEFIELQFFQTDNENVWAPTNPVDPTHLSDEVRIFDHLGYPVRTVTFTQAMPSSSAGSYVLLASSAAYQGGFVPKPDVETDLGIDRIGGRICYVDRRSTSLARCASDCLTYGAWSGDDEDLPPRCPNPGNRRASQDETPDNRTVSASGASSQPTPTNNFGTTLSPTPTCGNREKDSWEVCDGALLDGAQCAAGEVGAPVCTNLCKLDLSECSRCGNATLDDGEECDDALGDDACPPPDDDPSHRRTCTSCKWDMRQCDVCGDGIVDETRSEECDSGVGTATCRSLGRLDGELECDPQCRWAGCSDVALLSGGGRPSTECLAEVAVRNRGASVGVPVGTKLVCRDGDEGCDGDPGSGQCGFDVALCLRVADPRLQRCTPLPLRAVVVAGKKSIMGPLVAGVGDAVVTGRRRSRMTFVAPVPDGETCYPPARITVRRGDPAVVHVKARAESGGRDVDTIQLVCKRRR